MRLSGELRRKRKCLDIDKYQNEGACGSMLGMLGHLVVCGGPFGSHLRLPCVAPLRRHDFGCYPGPSWKKVCVHRVVTRLLGVWFTACRFSNRCALFVVSAYASACIRLGLHLASICCRRVGEGSFRGLVSQRRFLVIKG